LTPGEIEEIRAGVDANFTEQKRPVFKVGSKKWIGMVKWGFYLNLFFSISIGDQASLAMSPIEYLDAWETEPRLMAILAVIQQRVRHKMGEQVETTKRGMGHGRTGHIPGRPSIKR
jgi:hypothetical protein